MGVLENIMCVFFVGWRGGGGVKKWVTITRGHLNRLTCSESCLPLRKKPSRQPMTTASTDRMSRPFCLQTFFTRPQTSSRATAILLHLLLLLLVPLRETHQSSPPLLSPPIQPYRAGSQPTVTSTVWEAARPGCSRRVELDERRQVEVGNRE